MKKIFLIILIIFLGGAYLKGTRAQETDKYGNPLLKKLTDADAQRIFGDMYAPKYFKTTGDPRQIKESIISGNKITTILFNYGSICAPNRLSNIADLVWQGLGYGFEFGPLAAAEVVGDSGQTLHIVDDSFIRTFQGDYDPTGTIKWGWLPTPGYVDTTQNEIARLDIGDKNGDGKPDSWPDSWYNPKVGKYLWPAFLGDEATAPDEEVYYVDDDFTNAEFPYSPSLTDTTMKGLGLSMEVRIAQFNNPLAEDIMFLVYQITNVSDKKINKAYFGMQGDPHVGGAADYADDYAGFIDPFGNSLQGSGFPQRSRNMVYAWDDPPVGMNGHPTGYFGWKFLESPSNSTDNFDNDDDGITDETPENSAGTFIDGVNLPLTTGISDVAKYTAVYGPPHPRWSGDEDGDWNKLFDDVGIDGIGPKSKNYPGPDYGEGDGKPSQAWYDDLNGNDKYDQGEPLSDERLSGYKWAGSEPNFGMRDVTESDQIGLSSFHAAPYTNSLPNVPMNDPLMWDWLSADTIDTSQKLLSQPGDNIFNFGTGPLSLDVGETQRFSMCILFGNDLKQLVLNAESSSRILESDYRFTKPPAKPKVSVASAKGKVILYWDTSSEASFDPYLRTFDFEGYKIYRSRDYTFSDVKSITDGFGNKYLGKPLAQFDKIDSISGFSPVDYPNRGIKYYLGDNTGLVHQYVDSTVTDGITYYYAVVAYDQGSKEFNIPPAETQAQIKRDPVTGELTFDDNTVMVTPGGISSGYVDPEVGIGGIPEQIVGNSTGPIKVEILNPIKVPNKSYVLTFSGDSVYNVLDSTGVNEEFVSKDTVFVSLSHQNIEPGSVVVKDAGGNVIPSDNYVVNIVTGKIRGATSGKLPKGETYSIFYRYYPVFQSHYLNNEDANPEFDGMRLFVKDDPLDLDMAHSGWITDLKTDVKDTLFFDVRQSAYPGVKEQYRANWEIRWNNLDTLSDGSWANPGDTAYTTLMKKVICPFTIYDVTNNKPAVYLVVENVAGKKNNGRWDFGEPIILRPSDIEHPFQTFRTSYYLRFWLPDSLNNPKLPGKGDIFAVKTTKPFQKGDKYIFESKAPQFNKEKAKTALDNIYVVPNPYVAYSDAENPGRTSQRRGDKVLEFRNLPPKCTIRIYTITGELVDTIEKDDNTSMATWDLLSFEGQRIAYGVYIYHVEAPGVGEKIGRFAVIK